MLVKNEIVLDEGGCSQGGSRNQTLSILNNNVIISVKIIKLKRMGLINQVGGHE
jgi:hypothetical protein